ncbi:MAG: T9SS type A sorting domain-containing protein [Hymenobacter sp.]|nr:MAG: T9SS type A sorting domain-containing protein [Hymenobacter sp.]
MPGRAAGHQCSSAQRGPDATDLAQLPVLNFGYQNHRGHPQQGAAEHAHRLYLNSYADRWTMIYEAEKQWRQGAFVTLTWHACNPAQNVSPCTFGTGVTSTMSNADWADLVTDGTVLNTRWKSWLDELVPYFKYLRARGVEVAFRPFHEINQPAFWWGGRSGPTGSLKLYQITHDYLKNTKGLDNILWVWNIQDFPTLPIDVNNYSPGSSYFDVASLDFYNGDGLTTAKYNAMQAVAGSKPIAIGEIGVMPTAAQVAAQPKWTYFMGWSDLVFSQNTQAQLISLYSADPTTRWGSLYADPQELVVDLGTNYALSRVVILWEVALGKDYLVQGSTDNVNWTTLKSVTNNTEQFNEHANLSGTARYLKIRGTARGTAYGFSIRELLAYGSVVTATAPAQPDERVQLYPNPVTTSLTVTLGPEWPQDTRLTVLNEVGQVVGTQLAGPATSAARTLPTAGLVPGIYLLRVQRPGASQSIKFVKQ